MNYQEQLKERRYKVTSSKNTIDTFMQAWTLILASNAAGVNWLNKKKLQKELDQYAQDLFLTDYETADKEQQDFIEAEWQDFAQSFIAGCTGNKAYCSTLFGLVPIKDQNVAVKIAEEIENVLLKYPALFQMQDTFLPLYKVFKTALYASFDHAEDMHLLQA